MKSVGGAIACAIGVISRQVLRELVVDTTGFADLSRNSGESALLPPPKHFLRLGFLFDRLLCGRAGEPRPMGKEKACWDVCKLERAFTRCLRPAPATASAAAGGGSAGTSVVKCGGKVRQRAAFDA